MYTGCTSVCVLTIIVSFFVVCVVLFLFSVPLIEKQVINFYFLKGDYEIEQIYALSYQGQLLCYLGARC